MMEKKFILFVCLFQLSVLRCSNCSVLTLMKDEEKISKDYFDVKFNLNLEERLTREDFERIMHNLFQVSIKEVELFPISFGVRVRMKKIKDTAVLIKGKGSKEVNNVLGKYNIIYLTDVEFERKIEIKKKTKSEFFNFFENWRIGIIFSLFVIVGAILEIFGFTQKKNFQLAPRMNLFRYFQITDILLNFSKLPVEFDWKITNLFSIIESLRMPEIENPLNFFNNQEEYKLFRKGGSKIENNEILFLDEMNLFIVPLLLLSSVCFYLGYFLRRKNKKYIKILGKLKMVLFEITLVKYFSTSVSQIQSEYANIDRPVTLKISFYFSYIYVLITGFEFIWSFSILGRERNKKEISNLDSDSLDRINVETGEIAQEYKAKGSKIFFYQKMKYLSIQLVIATLSTLPRCQALVNMVLQLIYFMYFVWVVIKSKKKFQGKKTIRLLSIGGLFKILTEEITMTLIFLIFSTTGNSKNQGVIQTWMTLLIILALFLNELISTWVKIYQIIVKTLKNLKNFNEKNKKKDFQPADLAELKLSTNQRLETNYMVQKIGFSKMCKREILSMKINANTTSKKLNNLSLDEESLHQHNNSFLQTKTSNKQKKNELCVSSIVEFESPWRYKDSPQMEEKLQTKTLKGLKVVITEFNEENFNFTPEKKRKVEIDEMYERSSKTLSQSVRKNYDEDLNGMNDDDVKISMPMKGKCLVNVNHKAEEVEEKFQNMNMKKKKDKIIVKKLNFNQIPAIVKEDEVDDEEINVKSQNSKSEKMQKSFQERQEQDYSESEDDESSFDSGNIINSRRPPITIPGGNTKKKVIIQIESDEDDESIIPDKKRQTVEDEYFLRSLLKKKSDCFESSESKINDENSNYKNTPPSQVLKPVRKIFEESFISQALSKGRNSMFCLMNESVVEKKSPGDVTIIIPNRLEMKRKVTNTGQVYQETIENQLQDDILVQMGVDVQLGNSFYKETISQTKKIKPISILR